MEIALPYPSQALIQVWRKRQLGEKPAAMMRASSPVLIKHVTNGILGLQIHGL